MTGCLSTRSSCRIFQFAVSQCVPHAVVVTAFLWLYSTCGETKLYVFILLLESCVNLIYITSETDASLIDVMSV